MDLFEAISARYDKTRKATPDPIADRPRTLADAIQARMDNKSTDDKQEDQ